jgi:LuxR family maltose regulon positive regulatory protein
MTMAIFRDDNNERYDFAGFSRFSVSDNNETTEAHSTVPLVVSKLRTPRISGYFERDWLVGLVESSAKNAAATLIIGRAGAGKTALAAGYAARNPGHSWYSIDSTDADWSSFQRYFWAALLPRSQGRSELTSVESGYRSSPLELFADIAARMELRGETWPSVMILDGIHHLYDASWFDEFFSIFIPSLPHTSHVLLAARSRPTAPVWRMRSKQVLNVIDEKLLTFSLSETKDLFARHGLSRESASRVHRETFGRAADIMTLVGSATTA